MPFKICKKFLHVSGKLEREYEMIVKRTLQSICILNINPNTTTSVIVQVIFLVQVDNFSVFIFDVMLL